MTQCPLSSQTIQCQLMPDDPMSAVEPDDLMPDDPMPAAPPDGPVPAALPAAQPAVPLPAAQPAVPLPAAQPAVPLPAVPPDVPLPAVPPDMPLPAAQPDVPAPDAQPASGNLVSSNLPSCSLLQKDRSISRRPSQSLDSGSGMSSQLPDPGGGTFGPLRTVWSVLRPLLEGGVLSG
ncbi:unnamed protein product [Staurois parvus]|uniref:Uncharacterized protein n=1 Tax=Staurois parvus TaxID=386267 RepID=A0ABN9ED96_9NEOB|nr:unnamed protein product [Staurois parvus]